MKVKHITLHNGNQMQKLLSLSSYLCLDTYCSDRKERSCCSAPDWTNLGMETAWMFNENYGHLPNTRLKNKKQAVRARPNTMSFFWFLPNKKAISNKLVEWVAGTQKEYYATGLHTGGLSNCTGRYLLFWQDGCLGRFLKRKPKQFHSKWLEFFLFNITIIVFK